ncbi:MAG: 2Fe-2S iron-sulfur cluster-binding protein [Burkholderiaceae bacterium]
MKPVAIRLQINGRPVDAQVEARTSLGDFLRDQQRLTALHLACEHGVCGACNVRVDGELARACTTLSAGCDGAHVETLEAFHDDPLMTALRQAFSEEHALQCGFCTPGMLMAARDIVERLPRADEARIRLELSGNLCRCTGYAGIVRAVMRVAADWHADARQSPTASAAATARAQAAAAPMPADARLPAPAYPPVTASASVAAPVIASAAASSSAPPPASAADRFTALPLAGDATTIQRDFSLPQDPEQVWRFFSDLAAVASCLPGMRVESVESNERLTGEFVVKVGPIRAAFATRAHVVRDESLRRGRVTGDGHDRITRSSTRSELDYALRPGDAGGTQVRVQASFRIAGRLAEFSRPEIVAALATQLTERFAANVAARLDGAGSPSGVAAAEALDVPMAAALRGWLTYRLGGLRRALARALGRRQP